MFYLMFRHTVAAQSKSAGNVSVERNSFASDSETGVIEKLRSNRKAPGRAVHEIKGQ